MELDLTPRLTPSRRIREMIQRVCAQHGSYPSEIIPKLVSYKGPPAMAYREVCHRLHEEFRYSYPRIAQMLGRRDHSGPFYAARRHVNPDGGKHRVQA